MPVGGISLVHTLTPRYFTLRLADEIGRAMKEYDHDLPLITGPNSQVSVGAYTSTLETMKTDLSGVALRHVPFSK